MDERLDDLLRAVPEEDRLAAVEWFRCELWDLAPDRYRALADRLRAQAVDGWSPPIVFVEPTAAIPPLDRWQRWRAPWDRTRLGHDFGTDVPARLRAAGLTATTIERRPLGSGRTYVAGAARWVERPVRPR